MHFDNYDPIHFRAVFGRDGARLGRFLTDPAILGRLDASVEMRRPAAQAIAMPLLEAFGQRARENRFRQFVGHMICHLMRARGCEIDQLDVRIRDGVLFTRAARYRRVSRALTAGRGKVAS